MTRINPENRDEVILPGHVEEFHQKFIKMMEKAGATMDRDKNGVPFLKSGIDLAEATREVDMLSAVRVS